MKKTHLAKPIAYFAYGGNMNAAQMAYRCQFARVVTVAKLPDYRLAFFGHSKRWDGAEETVLPAPGRCVYGVVYELSHSALDRLDAWQGIRLDGSGRYFHSPAKVEGTDGNTYSALLYRKDILGTVKMPSTEYLAYILAGAEAQRLPEEYIIALQALETTQARYVVPQADDADAILRRAVHCEC